MGNAEEKPEQEHGSRLELTMTFEGSDRNLTIEAFGSPRDMRLLRTRIEYWFEQERENTDLAAEVERLTAELAAANHSTQVAYENFAVMTDQRDTLMLQRDQLLSAIGETIREAFNYRRRAPKRGMEKVSAMLIAALVEDQTMAGYGHDLGCAPVGGAS